jgi:hypothetical protein
VTAQVIQFPGAAWRARRAAGAALRIARARLLADDALADLPPGDAVTQAILDTGVTGPALRVACEAVLQALLAGAPDPVAAAAERLDPLGYVGT